MPERVPRGQILFAAGLAIALTAGADAARRQSTDVSIIVTVIDAAGKPITDLTSAEFAIREDGVDRELVRAKIATEPLNVALLADTSSAAEPHVPEMRTGLKAFIQTVLTKAPESKISLWEFGQASVRLENFTSEAAKLDRTASRLYQRARSGSVLFEALYDTSEALAGRPSPRRAIVLINAEPADEQSHQEPQKINSALMRSGAQVWAVSVQRGQLGNAQRDLVLNTLVRNAGGRREFIFAASAIEGYMQQYAAALSSSQYELTYRRTAVAARVVQVGVRRDGAKVIAGIAAPK